MTNPIEKPRNHRWLRLVGWIVLCNFIGGVAGIFTVSEIPGWYAALNKPSFNPPSSVFAPVWTFLYTIMGVAAWLVWKRTCSATRSRGLNLFLLQLALNFAWTWIFFHEHAIFFALVEIAVLWLTILATTIYFSRVSRLAAGLMVPYLAWVAFATLLNWGLWRANLTR